MTYLWQYLRLRFPGPGAAFGVEAHRRATGPDSSDGQSTGLRIRDLRRFDSYSGRMRWLEIMAYWTCLGFISLFAAANIATVALMLWYGIPT